MATDYDSPRKTDDELTEDTLEELKARRAERSPAPSTRRGRGLAESFELPGADLSGEELSVRVLPRQADEFTCSRCFLVHHRSQLARRSAASWSAASARPDRADPSSNDPSSDVGRHLHHETTRAQAQPARRARRVRPVPGSRPAGRPAVQPLRAWFAGRRASEPPRSRPGAPCPAPEASGDCSARRCPRGASQPGAARRPLRSPAAAGW